MFKRVLIANRGEIAIRIARAAASLGVDTVAVFTSADSLSLHTRLADKAREIGKRTADPVRGYLDIDAVIAAAKDSGSDCVHPGYGFLSENASFAERCRLEGLRFIGPSSATLALFGDKVEARAFAQAQGIPVVPGTPAALTSGADAGAMARSVGYPVMLKASAGGGGRGMRAVTRPEDMDEAFARCQGEALAAFGDRSVFLEKIVPRPRHIEVQVLGDGQGNVVHLHERDCSVQLRNQKVVEVAPAPISTTLRQRILADAVTLARARYENAARVEFWLSRQWKPLYRNATSRIGSDIRSQSRFWDWTSSRRSSGSPQAAPSRRSASPTRRLSETRAGSRSRRGSWRKAPARSARIASRPVPVCGSMPAAMSDWHHLRTSIRCSPS